MVLHEQHAETIINNKKISLGDRWTWRQLRPQGALQKQTAPGEDPAHGFKTSFKYRRASLSLVNGPPIVISLHYKQGPNVQAREFLFIKRT